MANLLNLSARCLFFVSHTHVRLVGIRTYILVAIAIACTELARNRGYIDQESNLIETALAAIAGARFGIRTMRKRKAGKPAGKDHHEAS
jgi:hypothetical protein